MLCIPNAWPGVKHLFRRSLLYFLDHHGGWVKFELGSLLYLFAAVTDDFQIDGGVGLGLQQDDGVKEVVDLMTWSRNAGRRKTGIFTVD